uniref:Uncharacterized protein n=1 Tax=viral metagenome TaxID=1070528 RepID=A0A6C0EVT1_9ZZZZ
MTTELTKNDYIKILEYYKEPIPNKNSLIKNNAQKILSKKLCRCIKKVDKINEGRSIGICTKSVFTRKGYKRGTFNCNKKSVVHLKKYNLFKNTRKHKIK